MLSNLENAGYTGELYLINPKHNDIGGRPCISSIDELPDGVDCAVLAIPRTGVMTAVEACVRRKIGGIVIFSAGFAEADEQGRIEQEELRRIVLSHDVIIEGPNCLGIANYVDGIALTFVVTPMKKFEQGPGVAVVSQSGAMAAVLGVSLRHHGLTISYSVSTGNEAAIGVEDFLAYMIDDNNTRVIAMIVEQFRNPGRFLKLVEQARHEGKSIVLLHPGTSSAARASAATHTGALASDYQLMRAKVAHAGVLAVDTLEELVDVTNILSRCPSLPDGGPVVFTESGAYRWELEPTRPFIFEQVVYAAKKAMIAGQLRPGDSFPSVRSLSKELKINPNTAHKIVTHLISEGLLEMRPGIGTVVATPPNSTSRERTQLLVREVEALVLEAKRLGIAHEDLVIAVGTQWDKLSRKDAPTKLQPTDGGSKPR